MQLTRRYLTDIPTFTLVEQPSGYIGTEAVWVPLGRIQGRLSPLTDKLSFELYGERMTRMKQLATVDSIEVGTVCEVGGKQYRVVSASQYTMHTIAVLEMIHEA